MRSLRVQVRSLAAAIARSGYLPAIEGGAIIGLTFGLIEIHPNEADWFDATQKGANEKRGRKELSSLEKGDGAN